MADGSHPLAYILEDARTRQVNLIPVTGFRRDIRYQTEVRTANKRDGLGVCVRIEDEDFLNINTIDALLQYYEVTPSDVDLVIDFQNLQAGSENASTIATINLLNSIPNINTFRTLTLAGSSFPEELSTVPANSIGSVPRSEWSIWSILKSNQVRIQRMPTFGDYAIANPIFTEVDPRIMKMSANIRYTTDNEWVIFRGRQVKTYGFGQFSGLSKQVIAHPCYSGRNFSWGDNYIYECAKEECTTTGNAETWRRVGTNHHLSFVVDQISSLIWP